MPASALLGRPKLGWLKTLKNCVSIRSLRRSDQSLLEVTGRWESNPRPKLAKLLIELCTPGDRDRDRSGHDLLA